MCTTRKNRKTTRVIVGALLAGMGLSGVGGGCTENNNSANKQDTDPKALNAALGAIIGGAAGAGVGALAGGKHHRGEGALIGGLAGAAAGGFIGYKVGESVEKEKQKYATEEAFLQKQVAQAQAERDKVADENAKLKDEITTLRLQYDQASVAGRGQEDNVRTQINDRCAAINKELLELQKRIAFYKESINRVDRQKNADLIAQLEAEIKDLETQSQNLQARREAMAKIVVARFE
jgi:chromosome segregation ATPase